MSVTDIRIGHTDRCGFLGMTGSGKTYRIWEMLSTVKRFAVMDAKHSAAFEVPGFPINNRLVDRDKKQIVRVPVDSAEERHWDEVLYRAWQQGSMTLVIDELTLINEQRRMRAPLGRALRTGRERGLSVWWGSQRPRDIPRAALTECDHFFIFMLSDLDDRKRVEGFIGQEAAALIPNEKDGVSGGGDCLYFHIPSRGFRVIPRSISLGPGPSPPRPETMHAKMEPRQFREGVR